MQGQILKLVGRYVGTTILRVVAGFSNVFVALKLRVKIIMKDYHEGVFIPHIHYLAAGA
jgi:hypothetical protein